MKLIFSVLVLLFVSLEGAPSNLKVHSVPGFHGTIPFGTYAGYLPANDGQKNMFFWFVESQSNPKNDPVILWLNGGPGCSSFDGFVYEHGPFFFESGPKGPKQKLTLNPYSWNMNANVIYLDSPAGVGLSFSDDPKKDYITNDRTTAIDSHNFLINFFKAFPEFKSNEFYISGESYAGIYVPTLAAQILEGNANSSNYINLQGILVGNGVTSEIFDGNAIVPFIYGHGLISDQLNSQLQTVCGGSYWNATGPCLKLLEKLEDEVADVNIYNIYEDCYGLGPSQTKKSKTKIHNLWERTRRIRDFKDVDVPCIDSSRASEWINQEDLRTAVHAISVKKKQWAICTDEIDYTRVFNTVIPMHLEILKAGKRILIYSGDTDMCVPYTGSEEWTDSLGLPLVDDWRPWKVDYQVAGYVRTYKQLTFATIKGSGHTVPQYKPKQSLAFLTRFLNNKPL